MTQAAFEPIRASTALASFATSAGGAREVHGVDLAQGYLGALVSAELMAAHAGVVPFLVLEDGSQGVAVVGGARAVIEDVRRWHRPRPGVDVEAVQTLYLAAHGAVRDAHGASRVVAAPVGAIGCCGACGSAAPVAVGAIPIAVYVACVAIAAVVASATYFVMTDRSRVQVDGQKLVAVAGVDAATKVALAQIAAGLPVAPELLAIFGDAARREVQARDEGAFQVVAGVVGVVAVGGALVYGWRRLTHATRRGGLLA